MNPRRGTQRDPFDLAHFQYRVIRDAINEGTAAYWQRRARDFAAALPRDGDFLGRSTPEQREARRARLRQIIANCAHRATLCELTPEEEQLILDTLGIVYAQSAAIRAEAAADPLWSAADTRAEQEGGRAA